MSCILHGVNRVCCSKLLIITKDSISSYKLHLFYEVCNIISYFEEEVVLLVEDNKDNFYRARDYQVNHTKDQKKHPYFKCLNHLKAVAIQFNQILDHRLYSF